MKPVINTYVIYFYSLTFECFICVYYKIVYLFLYQTCLSNYNL